MYRVGFYLFARQYEEESAVVIPRGADFALNKLEDKDGKEIKLDDNHDACAPTMEELVEVRCVMVLCCDVRLRAAPCAVLTPLPFFCTRVFTAHAGWTYSHSVCPLWR